MSVLYAGGVAMPDPVKITIDNEIIWSSDTGRTLSGLMVGDVVATKKKIGIEWAFLQESELATIQNCMVAGFFPLTFRDASGELTITGYRGTLSAEQLGKLSDKIFWYRSASVSIIQR